MERDSGKLQSGNEEAYLSLVNEWSSKLKIFAISYVRCNNIAEDLVQETFIKIWESRNDIAKYDNVGALIYTILRNKCLDYLKHKTIELKYNQSRSSEYIYLVANKYALEDESINIITNSQINKALVSAINKLPDHCRKVFIMSRFKQLKNSEIANELSISIKTVEYHKTKAISFLKKEMEEFFLFIFL